ncbi:MAG: hypothetical protein V3T20_03515 [Gemmatimonadota bacterium]
MNRLTIVWVFMAAWLAVSCASGNPYAGAEDITYSSWKGTITATGAEKIDIEWDGATLKYSWTDPQGTQLSCALVKQTDTLLSGACLDPEGGTIAQMTMSPPAGRLDSN